EVLNRPRPSLYESVSIEVPDITITKRNEPIRTSTENDQNRNLVIPTLTVTPVDATTARIQTLRQKLFSTPLQNLPSAMQYLKEEDDLLINRTLPTSETTVTLVFDDDLV
ncbi:unnamed protein product, partial [Rotaria magnacalcarata]